MPSSGKWHLGTMDPWVIESNWVVKQKTSRTTHLPENGYDVRFATESKVPTWDPMINPPHEEQGNQKQAAGDGTDGHSRPATENLMEANSTAVPFVEEAVRTNPVLYDHLAQAQSGIS